MFCAPCFFVSLLAGGHSKLSISIDNFEDKINLKKGKDTNVFNDQRVNASSSRIENELTFVKYLFISSFLGQSNDCPRMGVIVNDLKNNMQTKTIRRQN